MRVTARRREPSVRPRQGQSQHPAPARAPRVPGLTRCGPYQPGCRDAPPRASSPYWQASPPGAAVGQRRAKDMALLRNLGRRKLRTALTISGITIGIWALVVFGALATKIDGLVAGAHDYFGNRVIVSSASAGGGMFPLPIALVAKAQAVAGVDIAYGQIETMADHDAKRSE